MSMKSNLWRLALVSGLIVFLVASCKPDDENDTSIEGKVVRSIYIDPLGTKWFATEKGVSSYDGKTWVNYNDKDGLPASDFNDLAPSSVPNTNILWLASTKGSVMTELADGVIMIQTTYTTDNSDLRSDTVFAIASDQHGYTWIGTNKGLNCIKDNADWITQEKDVFSLPITRIGSSGDGWNYFATLGGGVARNRTSVDGISAASTYEMPWAGLPSDHINALYIEPVTGNQWFGTAVGAAYHIGTETKKNWTVFNNSSGLVNDQVLSIAGDTDGGIWFGTHGGVSRLKESVWTNFTELDGLANNTVYAIAVDMDGSVWFGTSDGVSQYQLGAWITYR